MAKSYAYRPRYAVLFYEYARNGIGVTEMCRAMGINRQSLNNWRKKKPIVRFALKRGKQAKDNNVGKSMIDFTDYVYGRLPRDLQVIWSDLDLDKPIGQQKPNKVRKSLDPLSKKEKQILFVHSYVEHDFNAAAASRTVMISYACYEKWKREDKKFALLLNSVHQMKKDYVEGGLFKKIKEGDINAILFASRTLNRDRGYDPKSTIVHEHQHGGVVEYKHSITLDQVINRLSIEAKRAVLTTVRQLKEEAETESKALPEHVDDAEFETLEDK